MPPSFPSSRRVEQQYLADILGIVRRYYSYTARFLSPTEWLEKYANQAAERMVTHTLAEHARTWRRAALEAGEGPRMYIALQRELRNTKVGARYRELIEQNAQYIKSLPDEVTSLATRTIARKEREGERALTMAAGERVLAHVTRSKALLLARTESAKANAALTQARAEDLGLNWYVWRTSEDQRVRRSHRKMEGVLINFDDAPSPELLLGEKSYGHYHAGNIFNCRCYMEPLLRLDQVNWPHRVYTAGAIRYMLLSEFRRRNQIAAYAA